MSTQPAPAAFLRRTLSRIRKAADAAQDISEHFHQQLAGETSRPSRRSADGDPSLDTALEWCDVATALPVLLDTLHEIVLNRDAQSLLDMTVSARLNLEASDFAVPETSTATTIARVWPASSSEPTFWDFDFPEVDEAGVYEISANYPPELFSRVIQRDLWRIHGRTETVELVFLPAPPRGTTSTDLSP